MLDLHLRAVVLLGTLGDKGDRVFQNSLSNEHVRREGTIALLDVVNTVYN